MYASIIKKPIIAYWDSLSGIYVVKRWVRCEEHINADDEDFSEMQQDLQVESLWPQPYIDETQLLDNVDFIKVFALAVEYEEHQ